MPSSGSDSSDIDFRELVRECARDPAIVAQFNRLHGLNLPCPIPALGNPAELLQYQSEQELLHVARFILWVQQNLWQRAQVASANLSKLQRFFDAKQQSAPAAKE